MAARLLQSRSRVRRDIHIFCGWIAVVVVGILCKCVSGAEPPAKVEKPKVVTEQCATEACHSGIVQRKVMHGPVAQKKCLSCHAYDEPREHRFKYATNAERLCTDCHTLQHRTVLHAPLKDGRCTGCHDPHGSDHRLLLTADPARGLCLSCHKQQTENAAGAKKFIHGPVASGACILCHEAHSSWQPKLLIDAPDKLCMTCHAEVIPKGENGRHIHPPVKEGCSGCHDAHASDFKFQLRQKTPDLCTTACHKATKELLASSPVVHGAVTQEGGCSACHAAHASALPKLQKATQPESCMKGCHDKAIKGKDGRELADMSELLKKSPQHHGPIREGACTACHQPHAGDKFRLLTASYPQDFYSAFDIKQYALCFNCHFPEMVLKKEGTGLTRFRDKEVNLHWLHVNREKGRTCRACHEVHASKRPFHIREAVPFGERGWLLEIKYEQTATGGTCAPGCHKAAAYDHGGAKPPPTVREAPNATVSK